MGICDQGHSGGGVKSALFSLVANNYSGNLFQFWDKVDLRASLSLVAEE